MSERDPFAFEEEDDDQKELADVIKERNRLGKLLRDKDKEIDRLKPFELKVTTQEREATLAEKFKTAGVDPKRAKYFSALNRDSDPAAVTKEQIQAFAREEGFEVKDQGEVEEPGAGEQPAGAAGGEGDGQGGFRPVVGAQSTAPTGVLSREDWLKLTARDPKAAEAAFLAGKVDLSGIREGLGSAD